MTWYLVSLTDGLGASCCCYVWSEEIYAVEGLALKHCPDDRMCILSMMTALPDVNSVEVGRRLDKERYPDVAIFDDGEVVESGGVISV
jgi:hypothetical protein